MNNSLQNWNKRLSECLSSATAGLLACVLTLTVYVSYFQYRGWMTIPPSTSGDEPHYDSIGWELSRGHGFQSDVSNPEFRELYDRTDNPGGPLPGKSIDDRTLDTTRPPLFPLLLSFTQLVAGRQLWMIRLWNIFCMGATCGLAVRFLAGRYGTLPALVVPPMFALVDVRTRLYSRAILTEATATLCVTLLCLSLMKVVENSNRSTSSRVRWFLITCLWLILGIYTRTNLVLWVPVIGLFLAIAVYRVSHAHGLLNAAVTAVIFANVILIGYLPWAIRNLSVTGEFLPLGTQGATQMSAAYGDAAWESGGLWRNLNSKGFFEDVDTEGLSAMEARIARARYSQQAARNWMMSHPGKTILLFPMKIYQSFRPRTLPEGVLLILSAIGLLALGPETGRSVFLTLIAACALGIGLTWSVEGRFLVPLLFVWHTSAAVGLWWVVCRITGTAIHACSGVESPDP